MPHNLKRQGVLPVFFLSPKGAPERDKQQVVQDKMMEGLHGSRGFRIIASVKDSHKPTIFALSIAAFLAPVAAAQRLEGHPDVHPSGGEVGGRGRRRRAGDPQPGNQPVRPRLSDNGHRRRRHLPQLDAGEYWQICMSGWNARGGNAFAIDPKNPDRILGQGRNGGDFGPEANGIYLSTDRGASWKHVLPRNDGNEWRRDSTGVSIRQLRLHKRMLHHRLFRKPRRRPFQIRRCRRNLELYQQRQNRRGDEGPSGEGLRLPGRQFTARPRLLQERRRRQNLPQINENYTLGLDVIATRPDNVYIARWDKVLVSEDAGETFKPAGKTEGLPGGTPIQDIRVSPADPGSWPPTWRAAVVGKLRLLFRRRRRYLA